MSGSRDMRGGPMRSSADGRAATRGRPSGVVSDLRGMWRLLELSGWRVVVAVAWGTAAFGSALALAALSAWLIARAWQMPPVLDLSVAVVAVRALGISRGLARYLERLATHDVALRSMTAARTTVYRTLAGADIWWRRGGRGTTSGPLRRGDLLVRTGADIDDLGAVVVRVFVPVAVATILAIAAVGLLAVISVAAALVLAAALLCTGVLAPWLSARSVRTAEIAVRDDRAEFTAHAVTVLDHAAELRVAGRLDHALDLARHAGQRAVAAEDSAASRSAWAVATTPLSIGVSVFAALLIGITLYGPDGGTPGAMTPMSLAILVLLPLSAFEAVGPLPAAARTWTTSRAAYRRLCASAGGFDHPSGPHLSAPSADEHAARPTDRSGIVPADDRGVLSADGADLVRLLRGFPPRPPGRRIAVTGPSGAGKTTLLMYWAGLFGTPEPEVTFFAEDAHLFGTSVLENLRVARGDLTEERAREALTAVGLGDWLDSLPEGVHTDLVGGAAAVSGGQRRRILLARALLAPARVLLLDEPTEHLEAEAGAELLRALLDPMDGLVAADRTVVVVTHQLPPDHGADTLVLVDRDGAVSTRDLVTAGRRDGEVG